MYKEFTRKERERDNTKKKINSIILYTTFFSLSL